MPELPEVETVVRGLRGILPGRSIVGVRLGKTDFMDDPASLEAGLPGSRIVAVERLGKFICISLDSSQASGQSTAPRHLIVHLGMTGRLAVRPVAEPALAHTHGFFELDDGSELRYTDPRRFGRIVLVPESGIAAFGEKLGAEPLEISAADFARKLGGRRARIKALLLDQSVLRGVGNIYADESLWRAGIHPARLAAQLSDADLARLRQAIRYVLRWAIRLGGSSISSFVDTQGNPGEFQIRHRAYHQHGKPCFRCATTIRQIIVAGRSSHFCPKCQPAPRGKRAPARASAGKKARTKRAA
jgi:formamidopyrimidine-DNA glycosylase